MNIKKTAKYVVMIGLNVAFFYYFIVWLNESIQWEQVGAAFRQVPHAAIAFSLTFNLLILYFYGKRLACLVSQSFAAGFWISVYGFGANNVLPFRLGDLLKLYHAKKYYHISTTKLIFVKITEKLFDLGFLFLVGGGAFLGGGFFINEKYLGVIALFLIVAALSVTFLLYTISRRGRLIDVITGHRRLNHFYKKILEIKNNGDVVAALKISGIIWLMTTLIFYGFFRLALPDVSIGYSDALALTFITALSLGIPSTPGALGVFEAAVVFYLTTFLHVDTEHALATAVLMHLAMVIPQILLMVAAMVKVKLRPLPFHTYHQNG